MLSYTNSSKKSGSSGPSHVKINKLSQIVNFQRVTHLILSLLETLKSLKGVLCLQTIPNEVAEVVTHLATLHQQRKQDAVFLNEGASTKGLIEQAAQVAPTMFRSASPVFMPCLELGVAVELRLDTNIICYEEDPESTGDFRVTHLVSWAIHIVAQLFCHIYNCLGHISLKCY